MIFVFFTLCVMCYITFMKLYPVFTAKEVVVPYGLEPFDICSSAPDLWKYIKITYIITFIFSNIIVSNFVYGTLIE